MRLSFPLKMAPILHIKHPRFRALASKCLTRVRSKDATANGDCTALGVLRAYNGRERHERGVC